MRVEARGTVINKSHCLLITLDHNSSQFLEDLKHKSFKKRKKSQIVQGHSNNEKSQPRKKNNGNPLINGNFCTLRSVLL